MFLDKPVMMSLMMETLTERRASTLNHMKLCDASRAGADGSCGSSGSSKPRGPALISQLVLVCPQLHQSHFSPGSPEETPQHTMLFLPAAALCWLGSALAAMATQLVQDLTLTRREGERVSISCGGTGQCTNSYDYWYQKKDNETFRVIFDIDRRNGNIDKSYSSHPQINDFSAEKTQKGWELSINKVKLNHSASYYCSCCSWDEYLFGSGTKLYVTGDPVVKPLVSVYPAASSAQRDRKGFLLCLASGMFPPEVQISWTRLPDGGETDLTSEEQLELREPNRTASILLVDQDQHNTSRYSCSVKHQGGTVEATTQEFPAAASCPPQSPDQEDQLHHDWSFQSLCRVKLLLLLYSVLIVKSLVFCCGLMVLRTKGPTTS